MHPLVSLLDELVRAADGIYLIGVVELLADVLAKGVAGATGRDAPAAAVVRVRPEQVTHGSLMRNFLPTVKRAHIVKGVKRGREATVRAEEAVINECSEWEAVEGGSDAAPSGGVAILAKALVVEAVHLGDLAAFVVATQERDAVRPASLKREDVAHGFDAVVPAVNVVAKEEVVGVGGVAADVEELEEVGKLPVDVADDGDGRAHRDHVRFLREHLSGFVAERANLLLRQHSPLLQPPQLLLRIHHC